MIKNFATILFIFLQQISYCQNNKQQIIGMHIQPQSFITLDSNVVVIGNTESNRYTLIDFYFTTCKPCNANIKKIEKLLLKYSTTLNVISVNPSRLDTKEKIVIHKNKYGISSPIVYGEEARKIVVKFKITENGMGYPYYILIDKNNKVVFAAINENGVFKKIENYIK
jgi:thiol-disulfide isomerase/thioredoxin